MYIYLLIYEGWMKAAGVDPADFSVGRTKVFL